MSVEKDVANNRYVPTWFRVSKLNRKLSSFLLLLLTILTGITTTHAALSAQTANTIEGTAPYIELGGIKATDLSSLLSIKIGGVDYVSDAGGNMKKDNGDGTYTPIPTGTALTLAAANDAFDSVQTIVVPDNTNYTLNAVIGASERKDADGDGNFAISGDMKGVWTDKNGVEITTLTDPVNMCNAPYILTLSTSGAPSISTQYGYPRVTTYGNSSAVFSINPVSVPRICHAKPDMTIGTGVYDPIEPSMWDSSSGFLTQTTNPLSYGDNFPTTGADGLYFDLEIAGVPNALTWDSVTVGNITATMSSITNTGVRVMLTGPKANFTAVGATAPAPTILPAKFELVGKDASNTAVVKYGFELTKWYVNRGNQGAPATGTNSQTAWCVGLNTTNPYRIVKIEDLTNAGGGSWMGASPSNTVNNYMRYIRGGLFSEWGVMSTYTGASFQMSVYWTSETTGYYQFAVSSFDGAAHSGNPFAGNFGLCTQP